MLGAACIVDIFLSDYEGDVIDLIGAESPVSISAQGDESNPFDPIRATKATVNIISDENSQLFVQDMQVIDDTTMGIRISVAGIDRFWGFVVPDQVARSFGTFKTEISITAQDFFSQMKGTNVYASSTQLLFGQQTLGPYIKKQLTSGTSGLTDLTYNIIAPYTLDPSAPELTGVEFLDQIAATAEGFNTSEGRPDTAYNIAEKIISSLSAYCFIDGSEVNIICPSDRDLSVFKTLYFKTSDTQSEFLIADDEQISSLRGAKEVSAYISFNTENGLLKNPFFLGWTPGPPYMYPWSPLEWDYVGSGGYEIERVGNNQRTESNSGALVSATWNASTDYGLQSFGTWQEIKVYKGWSYKVTYNLVYADYSGWGSSTDEPPALGFSGIMKFTDLTGKTYDIGTSNGGNNWFFGGTYNPIWMQLQSTNKAQSISVDIPAMPNEGTLRIPIYSVCLSKADFGITSANVKERTGVIYKSVVLSTSIADSGETNYLSQSKNFSLKKDKQQVYMDCGLQESVSGALFNSIDFTQSGTGTLIPSGSLMPTEGIYKDDGIPRSLTHYVVRNYMSLYRSAQTHVLFSVLSNTIRFGDLLKFDQDALPNVYMQLVNKYKVKECEQSITAIELNPVFLPDQTADDPDSENDLYEHYNTA